MRHDVGPLKMGFVETPPGLRPGFRVGQVWRHRDAQGDTDWWTIVAITDHPQTPIVARHRSGVTSEYDANGIYGARDVASYLDLVTLVGDVQ